MLSITNGEFQKVDILESLSQIAELSVLETFKSGVTRFTDMGGDFHLEEGKVTTENLVLVSDDFQIEGKGDVDWSGNLNFRLSVYLDPGLSRQISPKLKKT